MTFIKVSSNGSGEHFRVSDIPLFILASLIAAEAISYSKLSQVRKWLNFVLLSFWFLSFFLGGGGAASNCFFN